MLSVSPITTTELEGIVLRLQETEDLPVFLPTSTTPIFFFENITKGIGQDQQNGRALSAEFRQRFVSDALPSKQVFKDLERVRVYNPQDPNTCQDPTVGHWLELSPALFNPIRSEFGFFVRSAPKACMPFGASRYWVSIEPEARMEIVDFEKLNVTEF